MLTKFESLTSDTWIDIKRMPDPHFQVKLKATPKGLLWKHSTLQTVRQLKMLKRGTIAWQMLQFLHNMPAMLAPPQLLLIGLSLKNKQKKNEWLYVAL